MSITDPFGTGNEEEELFSHFMSAVRSGPQDGNAVKANKPFSYRTKPVSAEPISAVAGGAHKAALGRERGREAAAEEMEAYKQKLLSTMPAPQSIAPVPYTPAPPMSGQFWDEPEPPPMPPEWWDKPKEKWDRLQPAQKAQAWASQTPAFRVIPTHNPNGTLYGYLELDESYELPRISKQIALISRPGEPQVFKQVYPYETRDKDGVLEFAMPRQWDGRLEGGLPWDYDRGRHPTQPNRFIETGYAFHWLGWGAPNPISYEEIDASQKRLQGSLTGRMEGNVIHPRNTIIGYANGRKGPRTVLVDGSLPADVKVNNPADYVGGYHVLDSRNPRPYVFGARVAARTDARLENWALMRAYAHVVNDSRVSGDAFNIGNPLTDPDPPLPISPEEKGEKYRTRGTPTGATELPPADELLQHVQAKNKLKRLIEKLPIEQQKEILSSKKKTREFFGQYQERYGEGDYLFIDELSDTAQRAIDLAKAQGHYPAERLNITTKHLPRLKSLYLELTENLSSDRPVAAKLFGIPKVRIHYETVYTGQHAQTGDSRRQGKTDRQITKTQEGWNMRPLPAILKDLSALRAKMRLEQIDAGLKEDIKHPIFSYVDALLIKYPNAPYSSDELQKINAGGDEYVTPGRRANKFLGKRYALYKDETFGGGKYELIETDNVVEDWSAARPDGAEHTVTPGEKASLDPRVATGEFAYWKEFHSPGDVAAITDLAVKHGRPKHVVAGLGGAGRGLFPEEQPGYFYWKKGEKRLGLEPHLVTGKLVPEVSGGSEIYGFGYNPITWIPQLAWGIGMGLEEELHGEKLAARGEFARNPGHWLPIYHLGRKTIGVPTSAIRDLERKMYRWWVGGVLVDIGMLNEDEAANHLKWFEKNNWSQKEVLWGYKEEAIPYMEYLQTALMSRAPEDWWERSWGVHGGWSGQLAGAATGIFYYAADLARLGGSLFEPGDPHDWNIDFVKTMEPITDMPLAAFLAPRYHASEVGIVGAPLSALPLKKHIGSGYRMGADMFMRRLLQGENLYVVRGVIDPYTIGHLARENQAFQEMITGVSRTGKKAKGNLHLRYEQLKRGVRAAVDPVSRAIKTFHEGTLGKVKEEFAIVLDELVNIDMEIARNSGISLRTDRKTGKQYTFHPRTESRIYLEDMEVGRRGRVTAVDAVTGDSIYLFTVGRKIRTRGERLAAEKAEVALPRQPQFGQRIPFKTVEEIRIAAEAGTEFLKQRREQLRLALDMLQRKVLHDEKVIINPKLGRNAALVAKWVDDAPAILEAFAYGGPMGLSIMTPIKLAIEITNRVLHSDRKGFWHHFLFSKNKRLGPVVNLLSWHSQRTVDSALEPLKRLGKGIPRGKKGMQIVEGLGGEMLPGPTTRISDVLHGKAKWNSFDAAHLSGWLSDTKRWKDVAKEQLKFDPVAALVDSPAEFVKQFRDRANRPESIRYRIDIYEKANGPINWKTFGQKEYNSIFTETRYTRAQRYDALSRLRERINFFKKRREKAEKDLTHPHPEATDRVDVLRYSQQKQRFIVDPDVRILAKPMELARWEAAADFANQYAKDWAAVSIKLTREAIDLGLFKNPATLEQLYWPRIYAYRSKVQERLKKIKRKGKSDADFISEAKAMLEQIQDEFQPHVFGMSNAFLRADFKRLGIPLELIREKFGLEGGTYGLYQEGVVGMMRLKSMIEGVKLYRRLSEAAPDMWRPANHFGKLKDVSKENQAKFPQGEPTTAAYVKARKAGFTLMPNDRYPGTDVMVYGDFGGRWVRTDFYWDLKTAFEFKKFSTHAYPKFNAFFKRMKTAGNFPTLIRNTISAVFMFAPLHDVNPFNPNRVIYWKEALKAIKNPNSALYKEMKRNQVFRGSWAAVELGLESADGLSEGLFGRFDRVEKFMSDLWTYQAKLNVKRPKGGSAIKALLWDLPAAVYTFPDDVVRAAAYLRKMYPDLNKGSWKSTVDPFHGMEYARQSSVDYENSPGFVQFLSQPLPTNLYPGAMRTLAPLIFPLAGRPFLAFTIQGSKTFWRALHERPNVAALWQGAYKHWNDMAYAHEGLDPRTAEALRGTMYAPWKSSRQAIPMTWKVVRDDHGNMTDILWDEISTGFMNPVSAGFYARAPDDDISVIESIASVLGPGDSMFEYVYSLISDATKSEKSRRKIFGEGSGLEKAGKVLKEGVRIMMPGSLWPGRQWETLFHSSKSWADRLLPFIAIDIKHMRLSDTGVSRMNTLRKEWTDAARRAQNEVLDEIGWKVDDPDRKWKPVFGKKKSGLMLKEHTTPEGKKYTYNQIDIIIAHREAQAKIDVVKKWYDEVGSHLLRAWENKWLSQDIPKQKVSDKLHHFKTLLEGMKSYAVESNWKMVPLDVLLEGKDGKGMMPNKFLQMFNKWNKYIQDMSTYRDVRKEQERGE